MCRIIFHRNWNQKVFDYIIFAGLCALSFCLASKFALVIEHFWTFVYTYNVLFQTRLCTVVVNTLLLKCNWHIIFVLSCFWSVTVLKRVQNVIGTSAHLDPFRHVLYVASSCIFLSEHFGEHGEASPYKVELTKLEKVFDFQSLIGSSNEWKSS